MRYLIGLALALLPAYVEAQGVDADAVLADDKLRQVAVSAAVCYYGNERSRGFDEIKEQRKYAKIGGVISKAAIYRAQMYIRMQDQKIARMKSILAADGVPLLSCREIAVANSFLCIGLRNYPTDEIAKRCQEDRGMRAMVDAFRRLDQGDTP